MFIKWSCPLSHGRRFSCRRSARLERVCIARFAISLIGQVSPRCSTPLKVTANAWQQHRAQRNGRSTTLPFWEKGCLRTKSGKELDEETVRTRVRVGVPVRVHYVGEGDDMMVDRVVLEED